MTFLALTLVVIGQTPTGATEATNPLYQTILEKGLVAGGVTVKLAPPILRAGQTEADRRAALKAVITQPMDEFLRDSVNAPFQLRVRDVPYPGGLIREVDLWFAIHANLDEINLDDLAGKKDQASHAEAGNMSFSIRTLTDPELKIPLKSLPGIIDRHVVSKAVLLDRIEVTTINHVSASKTSGAVLFASMTDPAYSEGGSLSNRWLPLARPGEKAEVGSPRTYEGSVAYSRVSPISEKPSILLVESHLAFAEPKGWFNGTAILRSKLGLIAQDQVRQLRREMISRRKKDAKTALPAKL